VTGILLFALAFVQLPFEIAYGQHHLNRLWEREAGLGARREVGAPAPVG
jgi:hypothetical protein